MKWKCPKCGREFAKQDQQHFCVKPKTVDEYIELQAESVQLKLREIRGILQAAIPDAEECISWSMPTYRKGRKIIHIAASKGDIADKILLPGDPLRAKFIAENFLENPVLFNDIRNMFGYTGTYKGERVSVMGTGMGMPSISIYAHELITEYDVKKLIRVGTAGSLSKDVHVRELVLAQAAATTSRIIKNDWPEYDLPQIADFDLLDKAYHISKDMGVITHVGNV